MNHPIGRAGWLAALLLSAASAAGWSGTSAAREETPRPVDRKEVVKVRLVTVDVVVVDGKDRTVGGLQASDFGLVVDGSLVDVDTVDETCVQEGMESPRGGWADQWSEPASAGSQTRRIVFVFDYLHLPLIRTDMGDRMMAHTVALKQLARTLRDLPPGNEEIMIAALDGGLRVEQPFSGDRVTTLATLARMENDVTLYAGHFDHVSEYPLFGGLEALVDLLDAVPGSKALVLFTGGAGPGGSYEREYRSLASHASLARVSFYPVDCKGLGIPFR